jgi:autotransporter-associated beta strand protein
MRQSSGRKTGGIPLDFHIASAEAVFAPPAPANGLAWQVGQISDPRRNSLRKQKNRSCRPTSSQRIGSNSKLKCAIASACLAALYPSLGRGTPTVTLTSDSHGSYYLINNGDLSFQLYDTGALAGKITSIIYDNQQMVGSKDIYYDIEGSPNIYLGAGETYSYRTGSNFVDLSAEHPATAAEPLDVTWHWILEDGQPGFSTYLTYNHTTAMADYASTENRLGAEFFNDNLFHYSSIADNFWGYQAAGDPARAEGRYITAETADMRGIPDEYIKNYETKYDWRTTQQDDGGVTGIVTAANTSNATRPMVGTDFGVWNISTYRSNESLNAGPTHPQSPVADGASIIPSPAGSHFGGPDLTYTGNMSKSFGPYLTLFNTGPNINAMRSNAEEYATGTLSSSLNSFYDSLNLPYYATTAQRGTVDGQVRISDGASLAGATVILSTFDPTQYATDPISQEYQRRAAGYNYWVTPNANGTFTLPDVRPGTYRVTVIKPGEYREGTFDNITVNAGQTTSTGNLTFIPDIHGTGIFQIGTFDRTAAEFRNGNNYNNWIDTFNYAKEFPNGVNYTVNPSNPFNDTQNWSQNWPMVQENGTMDFYKVNFSLAAAPAANSTVTVTVAIAAQEFINDLAILIGNNRVDASFDHTADNAPSTVRSGDTSSRVLYRKLSFPGSWLHAGTNTFDFHIIGGNLQWDAIRADILNAGTFSQSLWSGGSGSWGDGTQWQTQLDNYTAVNKGTGTISNSTSTTFADGATATSPINNATSQNYYDAVINGGTVALSSSVGVQKLSLLSGTVNATNSTITANDAFVWAGGTFNGVGTINATTSTTVNLASTLSGAGRIISDQGVTWDDGASVTVTGTGSSWDTPGMSFGQSGASGTLTVSGGGEFSAGNAALVIGSQGAVSVNGGMIYAGSVNNAGEFSGNSATLTIAGSFTNSGLVSIDGGLAGTTLSNTAGFFAVGGTSTYTGATSITGGVVQFGAASSIGGTGASITVGSGGAVAFVPGTATPAFLSRINTASTGAFALTADDVSATLDFTAGSLVPFANMALGADGNVIFNGTYKPANNTYRLGGGGGALTFAPLIGGTSSLIIGNTGSTGTVLLNNANTYTGATTLSGGVLCVSSLANGGTFSSIGSSSNAATNLALNGGTLQYAGTASSSTDRLLTLGAGGGTLDGSGSGSVNFSNTGAIVASGTGNRTLTLLGSSTLANTFSPGIGDPTSGITSVTKDGSNTWILGTGVKTYSGDTSVLSGTLQLGAGAALPAGTGKGNLDIATTGEFEMNGQDLSVNGLNDGPAGAITSTNPNGWATPNGPGGGTLDNNSVVFHALTVGGANANGLFSGVISGNINLVKTGIGTQTLTGDNTYLGTTLINAGTLVVGIGGTPGSLGAGDGGFRGMLGVGTVTNNATLVFDRGYYTTSANLITGSGTLEQVANAELVVNPANNYTGPTIIGQGIANLGLGGPTDGTGLAYTGDCSLNTSVLPNGGVASGIGASSSAAGNLILDGGTLFYSGTAAASTNRLFTVTQNGGAIWTSGALTFTSTGSIVMSGTGNRTLTLEGDSTSASTFNCSVGDPASGQTSFTKDRSAEWIISSSAALTYSGDTSILMGTLELGPGASIPYGTGKGNLVFGTGTDFSSVYPAVMAMNGNNLNINALNGGLATYSSVHNSAGTNTLTVGNAGASGTFSGYISGGINLVKTGSGSQNLTGTNGYTGTTTVSGGTLTIDATTATTAALTTTPSITVQGASTLQLISIAAAGGTVNMLPDSSRIYLSTTGGTPLLELTLNGNTEVVGSFVVNGVTQPLGMYSSTTAPAGAAADEVYFSGNGIVDDVPEPMTSAAMLLVAVPLFSRYRRKLTAPAD